MDSIKVDRRYDLLVRFADSPVPIKVFNVCHIGTEGGLLRINTDGGHADGGKTFFWPLIHVFQIEVLARRGVDK